MSTADFRFIVINICLKKYFNEFLCVKLPSFEIIVGVPQGSFLGPPFF